MVKIEIKNETVQEKEFVSKKTGEVYKTYFQVGWMDKGDEYPVKVSIPLGTSRERRGAYKAGVYTLGSQSLKLTQYGDLEIDRYNLQLTLLSPVVLEAIKRADSVRAA